MTDSAPARISRIIKTEIRTIRTAPMSPRHHGLFTSQTDLVRPNLDGPLIVSLNTEHTARSLKVAITVKTHRILPIRDIFNGGRPHRDKAASQGAMVNPLCHRTGGQVLRSQVHQEFFGYVDISACVVCHAAENGQHQNDAQPQYN